MCCAGALFCQKVTRIAQQQFLHQQHVSAALSFDFSPKLNENEFDTAKF